MRLITSLILPEQEAENLKAIGQGEYRKLLAEEPWRARCSYPLYCECAECSEERRCKLLTSTDRGV